MLNKHSAQIVNIVYCTPTLAATVFIVMVIAFVSTAWCSCKELLQKSDSDDSSENVISCNPKSAIVAISFISLAFIIFMLAVATYACSVIKSQPTIFNNTLLLNVPKMIAAADGVVLFLCICTDIIALLIAACGDNSIHAFLLLSCNVLYALLSILLHCPYIVLAYINDAEFTGSVFIFYSISLGLMFLAIYRFHTVYLELMLPCHTKICQNCCKLCVKSGSSDEKLPSCCEILCGSTIFVLYSTVLCILILGVIALLTCYLTILPITKGISHLFGRLFDTYHTVFAIIGAFVAYKTLIEKKNN